MLKKTIFTTIILMMLFTSILLESNNNLYNINDINNEIHSPILNENFLDDDAEYPQEKIADQPDVSKQPPTSNGLSLNSLPPSEWQEDDLSVRVDYQAKNNTVKSLDFAYKEDFDFIRQIGSSGSGDGELDAPNGIATDSANNIYVTEVVNDRVHKFDSDGNFILRWGSGGTGDGFFQNPTGIAVDSNDTIWVLDTTNDRVQNFTNTGTYLGQFGSFGTGNGQFEDPSDIVFDSDGYMYISDRKNNRVQKFDANGNYISQFGTYGTDDGEFFYPVGIGINGANEIYVADKNNYRIQIFDSSGTFLWKFGSYGSGNGKFYGFQGIAVTGSGDVYVADTLNQRVQKFDVNGVYQLKWGTTEVAGSENGQFDIPSAIAVDSNGDVYVTGQNNDRVQKFGFTTVDIDPVGLLPNLVDSNKLVIDGIKSSTGVYERVYEKIHLGFTYFDMVSPTELGVLYSWATKKSNTITSIFPDNSTTLSISDLGVYSSSELRIELIISYAYESGFRLKAQFFDTGLNQLVSTILVSGVAVDFDFDNSVFLLDFVWAESQNIQSNIRSDLKYDSPLQTERKLTIDVFDYRIPLAIYLSWNFSSITPSATVMWDSINQYWHVTNTVPTTYEIIFINGQGWGINNPYNSSIAPVIDVTNEFLSCSSFECGNVTADMSSDEELTGATFSANTTIVSNGGVSLRMEDSEPLYEGLNLQFNDKGTYAISFDTYVESGHTWDSVDLWWVNSTNDWDDVNLYSSNLVADRWQKHYVNNFTVSGDSGETRNVIISFANGQGVAFLDNIHIWQVKPVITTTDANKYQFDIPSRVMDNYLNPNIPNHHFVIKLNIHEPETVLETWTIDSNSNGDLSFEYVGSLTEQGYVLEFNSTIYNVTISEYYFTPLLGSHYLTNDNYDVTLDDVTFGELIDLDSDTETLINGTLDVTSTGGDYWAYYNATTISSAYSVSTRIKHTGGSSSYIGLSFFDIPNGASASDDMFMIRAGSPQTIFRVDGVESNPMFVSASDTWYVIRADVTTNYVKMYIDNVLFSQRINTNPLLNPYFSAYGLDSDAQIDFVRISLLTEPKLFTGDTQTYITSTNNTIVSAVYSDGNYLGLYDPLQLIALNLTANSHNITGVPALNTQISNYAFAMDYASKLTHIYDGSAEFQISVNTFSVSEVIISTFLTATRSGNYTIYENDTSIGIGNFVSTGTSIQSNRNTTNGAFIRYSILFQNNTDTVWFNTTYSNSLGVVEAGNQLLVASYSIDADGGLFYATIETSWTNNTIQVYDNDVSLGTAISEGTSVWSFTTSVGQHNFSIFVRNGGTLFRQLNTSLTIASDDFSVSVNTFSVSTTIISTSITSTKDGSYTVYENNTSIGSGSFSAIGTSIQTNKNTNDGVLIFYSILFVNGSDSLWFNTTYSNAEIILPDDNTLQVASYSIDAGSNYFYTNIQTTWGNQTYTVFDNSTQLGGNITEGNGIWSFSSDYGLHNFTIKIYNGLSLWQEFSTSTTLVPSLSDPLQILDHDINVNLDDGIITVYVETNWQNMTVVVADNGTLLGDPVAEGFSIWTMTTDLGFHNITIHIMLGTLEYATLNGDAWDFDEGDVEGFTATGGTVLTEALDELYADLLGTDPTIIFPITSIDADQWNVLSFTTRAFASGYSLFLYDDRGHLVTISTNVPTTNTLYIVFLEEFGWNETRTSLYFLLNETAQPFDPIDSIWFDNIKLENRPDVADETLRSFGVSATITQKYGTLWINFANPLGVGIAPETITLYVDGVRQPTGVGLQYPVGNNVSIVIKDYYGETLGSTSVIMSDTTFVDIVLSIYEQIIYNNGTTSVVAQIQRSDGLGGTWNLTINSFSAVSFLTFRSLYNITVVPLLGSETREIGGEVFEVVYSTKTYNNQQLGLRAITIVADTQANALIGGISGKQIAEALDGEGVNWKLLGTALITPLLTILILGFMWYLATIGKLMFTKMVYGITLLFSDKGFNPDASIKEVGQDQNIIDLIQKLPRDKQDAVAQVVFSDTLDTQPSVLEEITDNGNETEVETTSTKNYTISPKKR